MNKFYAYAFTHGSTAPLVWHGLSKAKALSVYNMLSTNTDDFYEWGWDAEDDNSTLTLKEAIK